MWIKNLPKIGLIDTFSTMCTISGTKDLSPIMGNADKVLKAEETYENLLLLKTETEEFDWISMSGKLQSNGISGARKFLAKVCIGTIKNAVNNKEIFI